MKNILIATDFSPIALNAVHYGNKLAQDISANIILLNTYQIPISYTEVPLVTISLDEIKKISEDGLKELQENLEKIGNKKNNISYISRLGDIADVIEEIKKEEDIDIIITGTKGVSGIERFMVGSNTMRIIEKTKGPLITVPPGVKYRKIEKIAVATDLHNVTETTDAKKIKYFVELFGAQLYVLNVDHNRREFNSETPEQTIKLDELLYPIKANYSFVDNERLEMGINNFIDEQNIDLLIMLPRIHKLIEKILERSNTREMIKHTHIPILHMMKIN